MLIFYWWYIVVASRLWLSFMEWRKATLWRKAVASRWNLVMVGRENRHWWTCLSVLTASFLKLHISLLLTCHGDPSELRRWGCVIFSKGGHCREGHWICIHGLCGIFFKCQHSHSVFMPMMRCPGPTKATSFIPQNLWSLQTFSFYCAEFYWPVSFL